MDEPLHRLLRQMQLSSFAIILMGNALVIGTAFIAAYVLGASFLTTILWMIGIAIFGATVIAVISSGILFAPARAFWQVIMHLSPDNHGVPAPDLSKLGMGRELITQVSTQVYRLANEAQQAEKISKQPEKAAYGFTSINLPLPLFVLDPKDNIQFANAAAAAYLGQSVDELQGQNIYMVLDMAFPSENTLDSWLKEVKTNSATASSSWERVRLNVPQGQPLHLFDLAAFYNKDNPLRQETMLVLFDHTEQYSQDEQDISFIALSVHELRTPLTLLRGYIEAFEEEFEGKLNPQMTDFMQKMGATAQQLTAFVNNILNVARVDGDQLELRLAEEKWQDIVESAVSNLSIRAKVRGITLESQVAPDLPTVGVDRLSIHEVINNLVDNAIKYSGTGKKIVIDARLNKEGLVETTVKDRGVGIGSDIMPNLFSKFYRDHRNRSQVGGTGLGLYLCKAIISAHGGNIWVRSKPGQGSTFGFTLLPYEQLADEVKNRDNKDIVRGAHGWIKNHSLYRR